MKHLLSFLNTAIVVACGAMLLWFLGVNLPKRPEWSWFAASVAAVVIWESAKAGIAKSVVDRMTRRIDIDSPELD